MASSSAAAPPAVAPSDEASTTALALLRLELDQRDEQLRHLETVLERKQDEREVLFAGYQDLNEQMLTLRELVAARLGRAPPEPRSLETPPAAVAPSASEAPSPAAAGAASESTAWTRWLQDVEQELSSSKSRMEDSLARGKAHAQGSMQQLQDGWARGVEDARRGVDELVGSIVPGLGLKPEGSTQRERPR